jgi:hypothetical protein
LHQLVPHRDLRGGQELPHLDSPCVTRKSSLAEIGTPGPGLSQRELAERLAVPEQQVQRWEANSYSGVSVDRIQDIADALGLRLVETVEYRVCA